MFFSSSHTFSGTNKMAACHIIQISDYQMVYHRYIIVYIIGHIIQISDYQRLCTALTLHTPLLQGRRNIRIPFRPNHLSSYSRRHRSTLAACICLDKILKKTHLKLLCWSPLFTHSSASPHCTSSARQLKTAKNTFQNKF